MNADTRKLQIRRTLLASLSDCGGFLMPGPTLQRYAEMAVPDLLLSEYESELKWLESEHLVLAVRPGLGGPPKWKITDAGRAALAEES